MMIILDLVYGTSQWRCPVDYWTDGSELRKKIGAGYMGVEDVCKKQKWHLSYRDKMTNQRSM